MQMRFRTGWFGAALWIGMLGAGTPATAQAPQWAFRVSLADKAGSPALSNPSAFLSSRSLARRTRLGISVDETDRPVSPLYLDTALQVTGGVLHTTSRWLNHIVLLASDSAKIGLLAAKPWVTGVQVVGYYAAGLHNRPAGTDSAGGSTPVVLGTTGSSAYYGATWTQTELVHGDVLHDAGYKGSGMLIAVLDEGFSELNTHPGFASLRASGRLVDSFQFVRRTATGVSTGSYHGTQVLSTMAGFLPNSYVGSAPDAQYAVYATEAGGSEQPIELDNLIAATERADSIGADIVHASLGYNTFDYPASSSYAFAQLDGKTTVVARAANAAVAKGMLFVTTAGNEGGNSWNRLLTPGDADSALTVGNVASDKVPAASSGFGPNAAGRIKPEVALLGQSAAVFGLGGSLTTGSGTSFAAPQLAGWAACLWQAHPGAAPGQLRDAISRSADHYSVPGPQDGYGVPDFRRAHATLDVNAVSPVAGSFAIRSNPFGTAVVLQVSLPAPALVEASLYDVTGRIWLAQAQRFSAGAQDWTLHLATPPAAGVYFLELRSRGERRVFKLVHY